MLFGDFTIRISPQDDLQALLHQAQAQGLGFIGLIASRSSLAHLRQFLSAYSGTSTIIPGLDYQAMGPDSGTHLNLIAYWQSLPDDTALPEQDLPLARLQEQIHRQSGVLILASESAPGAEQLNHQGFKLNVDGQEGTEQGSSAPDTWISVGGSKAPDQARLACLSSLPWRLLAPSGTYLGEALALCLKAAGELRAAASSSRGPSYKDRNHQDLLTWHDSNTERTISAGILARWPEHYFVGEESSSTREWQEPSFPENPVWILDPIDGTANFSTAHRDYTISLGLFVAAKPFLGIVIDVQAGTVWMAERGRGAWRNGQILPPLGKGRPLAEATFDASLNAMLSLADIGADLRSLSTECRGHRAAGCASLNFCRIADGSLDLYFSSRLGIWDWAAGLVILNEVGGKLWQAPMVKGQTNGLRDKCFCLGASTDNLARESFRSLGIADFFLGLTSLHSND